MAMINFDKSCRSMYTREITLDNTIDNENLLVKSSNDFTIRYAYTF